MLKAIKYSVGKDDFGIFIEMRGENSWAVTFCGEVMDNNGEFEYEPSPSNRDEEFKKKYRFKSPEEAFSVLKEKAKIVLNGQECKF